MTAGLPGPSGTLLRRMRYSGGEQCGRGKLPAGSAPLLRRGLVVRIDAPYRGEWCLRLRKKKRSKKRSH